MKKQTQKHFPTLVLFVFTSLFSQTYADILDIPPNVESAPKTIKNELYGPEISSCQERAGEGWKTSKPDYSEYAKREIKEATIEFNKNITQVSPSLATFLEDKKISDFIDLDTYKIKSDSYVLIQDPDQTNSMGAGYFIMPRGARDSRQFFVDQQNSVETRCNDNNFGLSCSATLPGKFQELAKINKYISEKEVSKLLKNLNTIIGSYKKTYHTIIENVAKCSALYAVISNGKAVRGMDLSENNRSQSSKTYDGKLKCESLGYETQDYKACAEAATYYDAVFIGRKAVETVQQFQYMDKSMDIQTEMAKNAQTDAAAGLKAQKQDIQQKAEMARTRAATETAAVGALWHSMQKIPSIEQIGEECQNKIESANNLQDFSTNLSALYKNAVNDKIGPFNDPGIAEEIKSNIDGACSTYVINVGQTASHALIQNGDAREIIQQALIDAGVNIATMLGTAEILDKQAGRVGDAIKLVNDHDPESLAYDSQDILATECQINPGSENCVNAKYERGVGYHNDGISVSGLQFATSDSTLPIDETTRNTEAAGDNTNRTNTIGGIGATIDAVDKGSGLADSPLGAASVSSTGANGLGAGGGGGGAAGGGASAPANGSARTGGQGANKPYVGSSKKVKYSGGSGLSFSSGARRVAKKEKAENPFSSLFGKKGANKNGVLNFRGVASDVGSKNGSIFQMISKRYSAVSKDKRLEEYQKVNK
ncbi:hypothetical protein [Halobacteriovorax sp. JY17]|uniref:hypothetical protein n=1 Tax=Halobacteriovorax sp. JY17 TaxID=2014617 RepID=UPI000C3E8643|nr:hypothetical protein [Halobacteriovorax sp. JY17]PIK15437.1 MAG: hypothetical protein CES88_01590 [Halobacteriovorax sp. JY17]